MPSTPLDHLSSFYGATQEYLLYEQERVDKVPDLARDSRAGAERKALLDRLWRLRIPALQATSQAATNLMEATEIVHGLIDRCQRLATWESFWWAGYRPEVVEVSADELRERAYALYTPLVTPARELLRRLADMIVRAQGVAPNKGGASIETPRDGEGTKAEEWMTMSDAARALNVTEGTVTRYANEGKLQDNGKRGKGRRVTAASVAKLASAHGRPAHADTQRAAPPASANPERPTPEERAEKLRIEKLRREQFGD